MWLEKNEWKSIYIIILSLPPSSPLSLSLSLFGFSCLHFMTSVIISSQIPFQELNFREFLPSRKPSSPVSYI